MIAVPARVSPPRSLPPSPVLSAAPAVVIRQSIESATATPAVTLHSTALPTTAPHSPSRLHSHTHAQPHSYTAYYPPATAVVATPAAVLHDPNMPGAQSHVQHAGSVHVRGQPRAAVTAHTVDQGAQYVREAPHYCEHHGPVSYQQARPAEQHSYAPVVYARPHSPPRVVYQPPPTPTHYQVVYEAPPANVAYYPVSGPPPSHVYSYVDASASASQYYASALCSMAAQQPSLSPPHKPQTQKRATSVALPGMTLAGSGSAFTPVQPLAMYPRTGILIR